MDRSFNALSFVKDPRDIVKTGELVTVIVMEVDAIRKRISLTMKSNLESNIKPTKPKRTTKKNISPKPKLTEKPQGTMADALAKAFNKIRIRDRVKYIPEPSHSLYLQKSSQI